MRNDESKIRLGFIGVGNMGQCAHLLQYASLSDCELAAIAELREDLGRLVADRRGVTQVFADHRQMLASQKLDGVVAIQQFTLHGTVLEDVLASGLPVIAEKPIGRAVAIGEKLSATAKASGAKLYLAYHKRSDPAAIYARDTVASWKASGQFGKMRLVRMSMPPGDWIANGFWQLLKSESPYPRIQADPPEYTDPSADEQYVRFVNYYIHQVNLIRFLLGENWQVTYADPSGVILSGISDSGVPVVLEMQAYSTTVEWQESALVAFEKAWLRLDLPAPLTLNRAGVVHQYEDPGGGVTPREIRPVMPNRHAMLNQAAQFLAAIRGEATTLCTAEEATEDMRIARQYTDLLLSLPK